MKSAALLNSFLLLAACATGNSGPSHSSPPIDPNRLSLITRSLASDEIEGRGPGTAGEAKTIAYISEQFRQLGLEPGGDNGGWTQKVPLIRTQLDKGGRMSIAMKGETIVVVDQISGRMRRRLVQGAVL